MTRAGLLVAAALTLSAAVPAPAVATPPAEPALSVTSLATPTNFAKGDETGDDTYDIRIANLGGATTDGTPLTVTDTLPAGLAVHGIDMTLRSTSPQGSTEYGGTCQVSKVGQVETVKCKLSDELPGSLQPEVLLPDEERRIVIHVDTPNTAAEDEALVNEALVEGGGSAPASITSQNKISSEPAAAGLSLLRAEFDGRDGQPASQAASHPYQFTVGFAVNTRPGSAGGNAPFVPAGGDLKDIDVKLPLGVIGNPLATTRCTALQFSTTHTVTVGSGATSGFFSANACPDSSVVGLVLVQQVEGKAGMLPVPLYNLVPSPGMPAQFGAQILNFPFYIDTEVRPDHRYAAFATLRNLTQVKRLTAATTIIWGTPSDPSHDPVRGSCLNELPEILPITLPGCEPPLGVEEKPFLRLPSSCISPLDVDFSFDTWTAPGAFVSESSEGTTPSGCDQVEFEPLFEVSPTTDIADSPTGLHAHLHMPQPEEAEGLGEADLRKTVVTLPKGLAVNPSSANGLAACSSAQIGFEGREEGADLFSDEPAHCPEAARIGEVKVMTPLLDHPLSGSVFVATPHDNPFGSLLAIYIAVHDPKSGVVVKLAGRVEADPGSGQLTASFDETPQGVPFEDFDLDFFGGPTAALRTPAVCGTSSATTTMTPWSAPESGPPATASSPFQITQPAPGQSSCPSSAEAEPNKPSLEAGTVSPVAGAYSPLVIHLRREDGSQELGALTLSPPPGLIARLVGIPSCPDAALAAAAGRTGAAEKQSPSCPAASEVGTVDVGAGAGPSPYYAQGRAYLAGPYRGAPLSLAIVTPAVAGPYDLGTVVVRTALQIDPETGRVTAKSDPIPHILEGIPLDVRTVTVNLNRPNFTLNPTNCSPFSFSGEALSVLGRAAPLSDGFQVGECKRLRFRPELGLHLSGGSRRSEFPALRSTVTYPKGAYANTARASVALPHSEFLAQEHIRTICTRVQFAARACPAGSVYGHATATSPLVGYTVKGPVYLRSSSHPLPDIVIALRGPDSQPIEIDAVARIDSHHGGIRATFDSVPDLPIGKFVLSMRGAKGLLVNSTDICRGTHRATAKLSAQNRKFVSLRPPLRIACRKR
jgi:hypothetical protein